MRTRVAALLVVLIVVAAPLAWADGATATDDARGDPTLDVSPYRQGPVLASDAGCRDPAIDIVAFRVTSADGIVTLRLELADRMAAPQCHGLTLARGFIDYHMDLDVVDDGPWVAAWYLGGTQCNGGAYTCGSVRTERNGGDAGTFRLDATSIEWSFPVAGQTEFGVAYDLSGRTFRATAVAQSGVGAAALDDDLVFLYDEARAPDVTL